MARYVVTYETTTDDWDINGSAPATNPIGGGTGVNSVAKSGGSQIFGDVTLSEGSNITLTESGNDIQIASTGGGSGGGLLGLCFYAPGSDSFVLNAGTATSATDVDATNAQVTFTAPASGNVLIHLSALCNNSNATDAAFWSVRDGSTVKDEAWCLGDGGGSPATAVAQRKTVELYVSGLTSGNSYIYKFAYRMSGGSTSHNIFGGPSYGRLMMEVWEAP